MNKMLLRELCAYIYVITQSTNHAHEKNKNILSLTFMITCAASVFAAHEEVIPEAVKKNKSAAITQSLDMTEDEIHKIDIENKNSSSSIVKLVAALIVE